MLCFFLGRCRPWTSMTTKVGGCVYTKEHQFMVIIFSVHKTIDTREKSSVSVRKAHNKAPDEAAAAGSNPFQRTRQVNVDKKIRSAWLVFLLKGGILQALDERTEKLSMLDQKGQQAVQHAEEFSAAST